MLNIGFGELAVICILLIVVVGPQRLPTVMRSIGKTMRGLRQASRDIRTAVGIDEMMREDFSVPAPRPKAAPKPIPSPDTATPAASSEGPVSRQDGVVVAQVIHPAPADGQDTSVK